MADQAGSHVSDTGKNKEDLVERSEDNDSCEFISPDEVFVAASSYSFENITNPFERRGSMLRTPPKTASTTEEPGNQATKKGKREIVQPILRLEVQKPQYS